MHWFIQIIMENAVLLLNKHGKKITISNREQFVLQKKNFMLVETVIPEIRIY